MRTDIFIITQKKSKGNSSSDFFVNYLTYFAETGKKTIMIRRSSAWMTLYESFYSKRISARLSLYPLREL